MTANEIFRKIVDDIGMPISKLAEHTGVKQKTLRRNYLSGKKNDLDVFAEMMSVLGYEVVIKRATDVCEDEYIVGDQVEPREIPRKKEYVNNVMRLAAMSGLSVKECSEQIGVSRSAFQNYAREIHLREETKQKLAKLFGCSPEDIVTEKPDCKTCAYNDMDANEVGCPCWNCKAGNSEYKRVGR